MRLIDLGTIYDQSIPHFFDTKNSPLDDGIAAFYDYLLQSKGKLRKLIPNKNSYILISAGPDGIYGNADDICNF